MNISDLCKKKQHMKEIGFTQMVSVGCGIDVHQNLIVASIRKSGDDVETREFEAYTSSLTSLREWCKQEGVTHVAMESTGVYWKPVFNILEEDFEVILVNARHVKNVPGHKTDKKDSRWLSKIAVGRLVERQFYSAARHTRIARFGSLPQKNCWSDSERKKSHHQNFGRCQPQVVERFKQC